MHGGRIAQDVPPFAQPAAFGRSPVIGRGVVANQSAHEVVRVILQQHHRLISVAHGIEQSGGILCMVGRTHELDLGVRQHTAGARSTLYIFAFSRKETR